MKLSEAIMAGSTLVRQCASPWPGDEAAGKGCALTMAARAMGGSEYLDCFKFWPWLDTPEKNKTGSHSFWQIVSRFDSEVCGGVMTLEQLVDYVRSIEPPEDTDPGDEQADLTEQLRLEEEDAAEEGAAIEASGYPDPAENVRFA